MIAGGADDKNSDSLGAATTAAADSALDSKKSEGKASTREVVGTPTEATKEPDCCGGSAELVIVADSSASVAGT